MIHVHIHVHVCFHVHVRIYVYIYLLSLEPKCAMTMLCSVKQSMCARAPGAGVSSLGRDPQYPSWSGLWFCSHATVSQRHGSGVAGQLCLCNRVGQTQGSMLLTAISTLKPIMLCTVYIKQLLYLCRLKINHETSVLECAFILGLLAQMYIYMYMYMHVHDHVPGHINVAHIHVHVHVHIHVHLHIHVHVRFQKVALYSLSFFLPLAPKNLL
jgi:hypothetical protein